MKRACYAALLLALTSVAPAAPAPKSSDAHPLLAYARERELTRDHSARGSTEDSGVSEARHGLAQSHVPADELCAASIGASRFANAHVELGRALSREGDFPGAAAAFRRAHACRPRDPDILAALAAVLFDARDYAASRAAIEESLAIDPRPVDANRHAGNLDYVEEHWADAIARFRYVAASDPDRDQASYGQLMFWLAQRRAGVAKPELIARTPGEGWPQPLLLYMRGEYSETELLQPIRDGDSSDNDQPNTSTDERLCEALFYVGEEYWARGQPQVARDYFAALVNIKVLYFLEHGLALAEIAKLR